MVSLRHPATRKIAEDHGIFRGFLGAFWMLFECFLEVFWRFWHDKQLNMGTLKWWFSHRKRGFAMIYCEETRGRLGPQLVALQKWGSWQTKMGMRSVSSTPQNWPKMAHDCSASAYLWDVHRVPGVLTHRPIGWLISWCLVGAWSFALAKVG